MQKNIAAILAGLLLWAAFGGLLIMVLRLSWPAYEAVHVTKAFTLPMQLTRLAIGAAGTLSTGAVVRRISGADGRAVMATGALLLLFSLPIHLTEPTWSHYPGWYHLSYLAYLIPLTILGGKLASSKETLHA